METSRSDSDDETVIAQDEERPARRLTGPVAAGVTAASVLIAVSVLYQVFWPLAQGNQFSLILFLASTLPLVFLCYRAGLRLGRRRLRSGDNPTITDLCWRCWPLRSASTRCFR